MQEDLHRLFEQFGIEKVVLKKPDNSAKRPFAFVTLREVAAVAAATTQMNGHQFLGRRINVATANRGGGAPSSRAASPPSTPWGQAPSSSSECVSIKADSREGVLVERRPSDVTMAPPTLESMPDNDHPVEEGCLSNGPPALVVCTEDPLETSSNSSEGIEWRRHNGRNNVKPRRSDDAVCVNPPTPKRKDWLFEDNSTWTVIGDEGSFAGCI
ncbi:uncharacterized protein ISCGN_032061 [Ixodes scapularis]